MLKAREKAGLSQAELARRAGIPASVLSAYERGRRQPGADTLISILAAAEFELRLATRVSPERNGRILAQVLDLAWRLPFKPKPTLEYPPFHKRIKRLVQ